MKLTPYILTVVAVSMLSAGICFGANLNSGPNALTLGGRYHSDNSEFADLPYKDGDISYLLAYSFSEGCSMVQFGVDFAPDVGGKRLYDTTLNGTNAVTEVGVDYVITPQINMIFKDGYFRGGGGMLMSYVRDETREGEWINPYGQMLLGLNFPIILQFSVDITAFYVFKDFSQFTSFAFNDLEYGLSLNRHF